jgi:hypothetical protein
MLPTNKKNARSEYTTPVRVVFSPYRHEDVNRMLTNVQDEFGWHGEKWYMRVPEEIKSEVNSWAIDICFSDPRDATYFKLKYLSTFGQ